MLRASAGSFGAPNSKIMTTKMMSGVQPSVSALNMLIRSRENSSLILAASGLRIRRINPGLRPGPDRLNRRGGCDHPDELGMRGDNALEQV